MPKVVKPFKFSSTYYRKVKHQLIIQNKEYLKRIQHKINNNETKEDFVHYMDCSSSTQNLSSPIVQSEPEYSNKPQTSAVTNLSYDGINDTKSRHLVEDAPDNAAENLIVNEDTEDFSPHSDSFRERNNFSIGEELKNWAINYHIMHIALSALLQILIK